MQTRAEAFALLHAYMESESLRKHSYAVEAAMRWYARHFDQPAEEVEKWGLVGLLHDFDYERFPDPTPPDGHPYHGNRLLAEQGYPEDIREAIMGHAAYTGVPRTSLMAKTLFAVDELCGFLTAATLVRPDRSIHQLEVSSVKKRLKDKAFARGCNRDDIQQGTEELGIEMTVHIQNVIEALREVAPALGLQGVDS